MTHFPMTDTEGRMGRPPINAKPTVVRLTDDVRARIEALVGNNRMAVFIREAVNAELERREREKASQAAKGVQPEAKTAPRRKGGKSSG